MVQNARLFKVVALVILLMFGLDANCAALGKTEKSRDLLTVIREYKAWVMVSLIGNETKQVSMNEQCTALADVIKTPKINFVDIWRPTQPPQPPPIFAPLKPIKPVEQKPVVRQRIVAEPGKTTDDNNDTGVAIANTAKQYKGAPYIWGGTTPNGFDCSGYAMYVFAKNGIDLPRTSDVQYAAGIPISKNQLRPGDLVFFETYDVGASHVGIYIGNGEFLHASASKSAIAVARLDNSYFVERYVGSRRYY